MEENQENNQFQNALKENVDTLRNIGKELSENQEVINLIITIGTLALYIAYIEYIVKISKK